VNIQELVADLETKSVWVGTAQRKAGSDVYPLPENWTIPVIPYKANAEGLYPPPTAFRFTVLNRGVVAGPQTYAQDVYDVDGTTILHNAGDPVLDEQGNPVVIAPEDAETVLVERELDKEPVLFAQVQTYLNTLVPGTYIRVEAESVDEGDMYGFAKAWKITSATECQEVRLIVWKDQGQPVAYREIV